MPTPPDEWDDRFADLERALAKQQEQIQPIVNLYNAGSMIGKLLWIIGGFIVGVTTIWAAISGWVTSHWK